MFSIFHTINIKSELIIMPDTWINIPVDIWAILLGFAGIIITTIGIIKFKRKSKKIKDEENARLNLPLQQKVYIIKNTGNKFIIFIGIVLIALFITYFAFQIYNGNLTLKITNDKEELQLRGL